MKGDMKVLILGGTGAMGKPLQRILSEQNSVAKIKITSRFVRASDNSKIEYIQGNARDTDFLKNLLSDNYDVVIDFMNYDLDEFANRIELLLSSTDHYIWFSSCRVYAESSIALTEESPRLLESSQDNVFLATNRYALRKARQEDLLNRSGYNNYTIIRPYITYNTERLQLGILEKEQWLYRLLKGKPLVISSEMLEHTTALTHGYDVAQVISDIVKLDKPTGDTVQIVGRDTIKWRELLALYVDVLSKRIKGFAPEIYKSSDIKPIEQLYEGGYNTIYDRNYDRWFDSHKIEAILGRAVNYRSINQGITSCLEDFLTSGQFLRIDPVYEALQDELTGTTSSREDFEGEEDYQLYISTLRNATFAKMKSKPALIRFV